MNRKYLISVSALIIFCVYVFLYFNTLRYPFHYDDWFVIVSNENIRNLSGIKSIIMSNPQRAVLNFSFALNYSLGGLETFGYHVVNIALHFLNAVLLYFIVLRLFPSYRRVPSMFFPSLIFLFHPVNVESVTYISSRSSVLCTFFYLLAILFYIKAIELAGGKLQIKFLSISVLSFILSCFSKESGITLPLMLLLIDLFMCSEAGQKLEIKRSAIIQSPYWAVVLFVFIERFYSYGTIGNSFFHRGPLSQFYSQVCSFLYGIKLLFIPINLNVDHYFREIISPVDLKFLFSAAVIFAMVFMIMRFRTSSSLTFPFLWILISQLPILVIPVQDSLSERWLYQSTIGAALFLAFVTKDAGITHMNVSGNRKIIILVAVILMFSALTYERNKVWKDKLTLWTDALRKSPEKGRPYLNVGIELMKKGNIKEAAEMFKRGTVITDLPVFREMSIAYFAFKEGKFEEAEGILRSLIASYPQQSDPYYLLGTILREQKKYDEALDVLNDMKTRFPSYIDAALYSGAIYMDMGRLDDAEGIFNGLLSESPENLNALTNLGTISFLRGEFDKAEQFYLRALEQDKMNADVYFDLGLVEVKRDDVEKAVIMFDKCLKIVPVHERALYSKGIALAGQGDYKSALDTFNRFMQMYPEKIEAYTGAAEVCKRMGDIKSADEYLKKAEALKRQG